LEEDKEDEESGGGFGATSTKDDVDGKI